MELPRDRQSFLLSRFRQFYAEAVRLRTLVEQSRFQPLSLPAAPPADDLVWAQLQTLDRHEPSPPLAHAPAPANDMVWTQLLALLERQAIEAGQTGGSFAFEIYREAQYVMAALADEIFLHIEWEGRHNWELLEARLFQTQIAGEAVFQRLDRLLQRRDPFYLDLAAVYFMALSLGFQGKFRGDRDMEPLFQYRRLLFNMLYRRNPKLFSGNDALFPQNENTLIEGLGKKLPDPRLWVGAAGLVLILWLAASGTLWGAIHTPLDCLICQVMGTACACDASGTP